MPKVVGIRFHGSGKAYHFSPGEFSLHQGDAVIVETSRGQDLGIVADAILELPEEKIVKPLKTVLRIANEQDLTRFEENRKKEKDAYKIAKEKIQSHKLKMNLVDVEYGFDRRKIVFYFTADGRVDFRSLVKDLAGIFRTRIELRQIGVRDEARMIGGLGVCGRELCCCSFMNDFVPVSIKMAKVQNMSMNPSKISGVCGRLMCCLKYEHEAYEDARRRLPRKGDKVMTQEGEGRIENVDMLRERLTVRLDRGGEADLVVVQYEDVDVIESRRPHPSRRKGGSSGGKGKPCCQRAAKDD